MVEVVSKHPESFVFVLDPTYFQSCLLYYYSICGLCWLELGLSQGQHKTALAICPSGKKCLCLSWASCASWAFSCAFLRCFHFTVPADLGPVLRAMHKATSWILRISSCLQQKTVVCRSRGKYFFSLTWPSWNCESDNEDQKWPSGV